MKIILLKDVRNVGRKDEIKDVADGYANNFLLRQNLAIVASADRIAAVEKKHAEIHAAHTAEEAKLDNTIRELKGTEIELSARATPKGGLFKSVTAADIARAVQEQKKRQIPSASIELGQPIKTTGKHTIALASKNARAEMILVIAAAK